MSIIDFLKNGSGIHIKKKNKGKFTDFCEGKVTQECIERGKRSPNPITRKRATFADNARHWVKKGLNGLVIQLGNLIRHSYGYPVYWSNNIPTKYKWVSGYLKNHPDVTGMAIGGGALGEDDLGPRMIVRNSYSNIITDPNDSRWEGLDKIEAIRHFMNETNYNPKFKISSEQDEFRKTNFNKDAPYNTNDNAWKQSIMSRILTGDMEGTPELMEESNKFMLTFNKRLGKFQQGGPFNLVEYIKAIENPNKVGWNGKVWVAPKGAGFDSNLRGYGIDIKNNNKARELASKRQGQYLTDLEVMTLMNDHIKYIDSVARKRIPNYDNFSKLKKYMILGMLYRGDSVNSNLDTKQNDNAFFNAVHDYYRSKGLNERANNSINFLNNMKKSEKHIAKPEIKLNSFEPVSTKVLKPIVFKDGGNLMFLQAGNKLLQGAGNIASGIISTIKQNKQINSDVEALKAYNKMALQLAISDWNNEYSSYKNNLLNKWKQDFNNGLVLDNPSEIVANHLGRDTYNQKLALIKNLTDAQNSLLDAQAKLAKSLNVSNAISSVMEQGMGMVSNYLSNKSNTGNSYNSYFKSLKPISVTTPSPSFMTGTQLANSIKIKY